MIFVNLFSFINMLPQKKQTIQNQQLTGHQLPNNLKKIF